VLRGVLYPEAHINGFKKKKKKKKKTLKTERSGTVVAQRGVLKGSNGSLEGEQR
jgi:hypothetical protein